MQCIHHLSEDFHTILFNINKITVFQTKIFFLSAIAIQNLQKLFIGHVIQRNRQIHQSAFHGNTHRYLRHPSNTESFKTICTVDFPQSHQCFNSLIQNLINQCFFPSAMKDRSALIYFREILHHLIYNLMFLKKITKILCRTPTTCHIYSVLTINGLNLAGQVFFIRIQIKGKLCFRRQILQDIPAFSTFYAAILLKFRQKPIVKICKMLSADIKLNFPAVIRHII